MVRRRPRRGARAALSAVLPEYLERAPHPVPADAAAEFDEILRDVAERAAASPQPEPPLDLSDRTDRPLWQLLAHAAATGRFALHGSGSDDIVEFEPRQADDTHEFGNRKGVYAAADGLWPYYFAIVDRDRIESLINAAGFLLDPESGLESGPYYFFSIAGSHPSPWRDGTVYLLPIDGFEREPPMDRGGIRVRSAQLFCPGAVRPVARVRVQPSGFPLLAAIRRHDAATMQRAITEPDGFPWL